jgi:hypothetical protein
VFRTGTWAGEIDCAEAARIGWSRLGGIPRDALDLKGVAHMTSVSSHSRATGRVRESHSIS